MDSKRKRFNEAIFSKFFKEGCHLFKKQVIFFNKQNNVMKFGCKTKYEVLRKISFENTFKEDCHLFTSQI